MMYVISHFPCLRSTKSFVSSCRWHSAPSVLSCCCEVFADRTRSSPWPHVLHRGGWLWNIAPWSERTLYSSVLHGDPVLEPTLAFAALAVAGLCNRRLYISLGKVPQVYRRYLVIAIPWIAITIPWIKYSSHPDLSMVGESIPHALMMYVTSHFIARAALPGWLVDVVARDAVGPARRTCERLLLTRVTMSL